MIAIAFIAFAVLVCAWVFGPNTEPKAAVEMASGGVQVGEAAA